MPVDIDITAWAGSLNGRLGHYVVWLVLVAGSLDLKRWHLAVWAYTSLLKPHLVCDTVRCFKEAMLLCRRHIGRAVCMLVARTKLRH